MRSVYYCCNGDSVSDKSAPALDLSFKVTSYCVHMHKRIGKCGNIALCMRACTCVRVCVCECVHLSECACEKINLV